jgi:ankyrin repeat protein
MALSVYSMPSVGTEGRQPVFDPRAAVSLLCARTVVSAGPFLMSDRVITANEGSAESQLHGAAWCGDLAEVTRLVEGGADVNWWDSISETALFGAAAWGHVGVVRYLLSVGANYNIAESNGYTPLHWAASHGNIETLKVLLEAGADPTAADHQGRLPVDVAHKHGKGAHVSHLKSIGPPIASRRKERC